MRIRGHCPVRAGCLNYPLSGPGTCGGSASGIWGGGTTARERAQLRRQHRAAVA
jgi:hypothetical protein